VWGFGDGAERDTLTHPFGCRGRARAGMSGSARWRAAPSAGRPTAGDSDPDVRGPMLGLARRRCGRNPFRANSRPFLSGGPTRREGRREPEVPGGSKVPSEQLRDAGSHGGSPSRGNSGPVLRGRGATRFAPLLFTQVPAGFIISERGPRDSGTGDSRTRVARWME
jgi:hypothetical protein